MKILVIPSWYPPNGGRFFKLQAESLAKLGHDVDVLILEEKGVTQKRNIKIENKKSTLVNEIRYKFYRIPKLNELNVELFIRKYKKILTRYLTTHKPDVIQVHSAIWGGVVVSEIVQKFNIPYIITEHRSLFLKEKLGFKEQLINRVKIAFNRANKVLVVSSEMKHRVGKYTTNQIEVLPNMVDTNFFVPKIFLKKSENIEFVSVGNLIPVKGFEILLQAFSKIKEKNSHIKLKIVGSGDELANLQELITKLDLNYFVEFCGYKTKKELLEIYQYSDIFISSSKVETFGVAIIEALSCGLPIVVTNSGGPADIVNSKNGYLAEKENVDSLFQKMQLMIDNLANFEAEIIRKNTIANYSEEVISKKLENYLNQCLQNRKQ